MAETWEPSCRRLTPRQFLSENRCVAGKTEAGFQIDLTGTNQLGNLAIEVLHAFALTRLHSVEQRAAGALALFDAIARPGIGFENFKYCHAALAVRARNQP